MSADPLSTLALDDHESLYEPEGYQMINVTSDGGNIGRFHWHNQGRYTIEQFNSDGTLYNRESWEIPGGFAFVWTAWDYFVFLMS